MDTLIERLFEIVKKIGVTRVCDVSTYVTPLIYVYQSCRPGAFNLIVDSGKGLTRKDAIVSCCVESIERYTSENFINKQYQKIPDFLETSGLCRDASLCIKGKEIKNINTVRSVDIPIESVSYNLSLCSQQRLLYARPGTSGLGAHLMYKDAIYSGLIELLERDAIMSSIKGIKIDVSTLPLNFRVYLHWIEKEFSHISVYYHPSEHPVHVFSIESHDEGMVGALAGMGASYSLENALNSAFIEAIQTLVMRISGSRDDWIFALPSLRRYSQYSGEFLSKWEDLRLAHPLDFGSTNREHFNYLLEYCHLHGLSIYYARLSSEININPIKVVKVICPWLHPVEQGNMLTGVPRQYSMQTK